MSFLDSLPKGSEQKLGYCHNGILHTVKCKVQRQSTVLLMPTDADLLKMQLPRDFWQVRALEDKFCFEKGMQVLCVAIADRSKIGTWSNMQSNTTIFSAAGQRSDKVQVACRIDPRAFISTAEKEDIILFYCEKLERQLLHIMRQRERPPAELPRGYILHSQSWSRDPPPPPEKRARPHGDVADSAEQPSPHAPDTPALSPPELPLTPKSLVDLMYGVQADKDLRRFPPGTPVKVMITILLKKPIVTAEVVTQGDFFETEEVREAADMMTVFPKQFWVVRFTDAIPGVATMDACVNVIGMKRKNSHTDKTEYLFVYAPDYETTTYRRISNGGRMNFLRTLTVSQNIHAGRIIFSEPLLSHGAHNSDTAAHAAQRARDKAATPDAPTAEAAASGGAAPSGLVIAAEKLPLPAKPTSRARASTRKTSIAAQVARKMVAAGKYKNSRDALAADKRPTASAPYSRSRPTMTAATLRAAHNAKRPSHYPDCPFQELQDHLATCPLYDEQEGPIEEIAPNPDVIDWLVRYFHKRPPREVIRHFGRFVSAKLAHWIAGED
jgi:hypothetical protein